MAAARSTAADADDPPRSCAAGAGWQDCLSRRGRLERLRCPVGETDLAQSIAPEPGVRAGGFRQESAIARLVSALRLDESAARREQHARYPQQRRPARLCRRGSAFPAAPGAIAK